MKRLKVMRNIQASKSGCGNDYVPVSIEAISLVPLNVTLYAFPVYNVTFSLMIVGEAHTFRSQDSLQWQTVH